MAFAPGTFSGVCFIIIIATKGFVIPFRNSLVHIGSPSPGAWATVRDTKSPTYSRAVPHRAQVIIINSEKLGPTAAGSSGGQLTRQSVEGLLER